MHISVQGLTLHPPLAPHWNTVQIVSPASLTLRVVRFLQYAYNLFTPESRSSEFGSLPYSGVPVFGVYISYQDLS